MVAGVGDEDFTKFLDLDSDFQHFTAMNNGHSGLDTPMGRLGFGNSANDLSYTGPEQLSMNTTSGNDAVTYRSPMPPNQQYNQYPQYQQMQMPQQYHVPPTPVSAEMHAGKYAHQMGNNGQILFDHQQVCEQALLSPPQCILTLCPRCPSPPLSHPRKPPWMAGSLCLITGWPTSSSAR